MVSTRDIHVRPHGTSAPAAPRRDADAAPRPITLRDIEALPPQYREAATADYLKQQKARAKQSSAPEVPTTSPTPASLTSEERQVGQRFQDAASAVAKRHPAPGLHLTWDQLDRLRAEDPDGFAAWSRAPRALHLRNR